MDYKAGSFIYALAVLLGVLAVQQLSVLPDNFSIIFLSCLIFFCGLLSVRFGIKKPAVLSLYCGLITSLITLILIGFIGSSCFAERQLSHRLSEAATGQSIVINGMISSIPASHGKVQSFEFDIEAFRFVDASLLSHLPKRSLFPERVRLNWYYGLPVNAGEYWQFEVRLKPPHGFLNPGGFDYEAWLFQHGIDATGYVRKSALNQRIDPRSSDAFFSMTEVMGWVNRMRQHLAEKVDALAAKNQTGSENSFSLIKALAIGDKSSISIVQWRVLANTGTSHLMAISGLHIGLAMLFAYTLIRRLLPVILIKRIPAQHIALIFGAAAALCYALIAGLSIPTQRAIIMLFVLSVMMLIRRNHRPVDALGAALLLVLLFDPLAVLSVGFWFSFSAVAVIFICAGSPRNEPENESEKKSNDDDSVFANLLPILQQWVRLQLLISLFLLPLSLFMFQQVSLVSPLANLLLIPYLSFLVVPIVLLAIICTWLFPFAADWLFVLAAFSLDFVWSFTVFLSELPFALWVQGEVGIVRLLLATLLMLMLFFSAQFSRFISQNISRYRNRAVCFTEQSYHFPVWLLRAVLSVFLLVLVFAGSKAELMAEEYQVVVLDVGQGSAAVIQTASHVAVFDSGARFSEKLDAGRSVVIPYLRSQGVRHLDRLIVSHGDADHIGGAQAILDEFPGTPVLGQDIESLNAGKKILCQTGQQWQWDGVDFKILSPEYATTSSQQKTQRNDRSCVLQVSSKAGVTLFTGDIEKKAEKYLLANLAEQLPSDILLVPHHGSKTSSSQAFIDLVNPKIALISAGYKNRYRLPSNKVVSRYQRSGSQLLLTANSGAITIKMGLKDGISFNQHRQLAKRYWHHQY